MVNHKPAIYQYYQLLWAGLDWLYPPFCGGCEIRGRRWCLDCQARTALVPDSICIYCGIPTASPGVCSRCHVSPPIFAACRSWAFFEGPLRNALHRLKYKRDIALGESLSKPLMEMLLQLGWQLDLITVVPLSKARQVERGYNQATLLAFPIALRLGVKYQSKALKKIRETRSQVGLTFEQRHANVISAFSANREYVFGKQVLLMDDIVTSGATINACAQALSLAGASRVYALTLARTPYEGIVD